MGKKQIQKNAQPQVQQDIQLDDLLIMALMKNKTVAYRHLNPEINFKAS